MGTSMRLYRYPVGMGMRQKFNTRWIWIWGWRCIFFTGMGMK